MVPKEYSVKGKVAIVTGAGRGIGKSIALILAEGGADVTVTARTAKQIEATAGEIRKLGRKALAVPADVTESSDIKRVVQKTIAEFGRIDILVNNAGIDILKPIVFIPEMRKKKLPEWQVADTWDKPLTEAD